MNVNSNDLLNQLTSRRTPDVEELDEAMMRAVLRVLRHGDNSVAARHDRFGLFLLNGLLAVLQRQFQTMAYDVFAESFDRTIKSLVKSEKIEICSAKIRALYGHSLRGVIVGQMRWPDSHLFHATCERNLASILKHGLRSRSRTWVHLTSSLEYATDILNNHAYEGRPVLLKIVPCLLEDYDVTFRKPNSHVWLVNHVPPAAIEVSDLKNCSEIDA